MSASAGPARAWRGRSTTTRTTLDVVPRPRHSAPRTPFVALVVAILALGLVGLLVLNTSMQRKAFELASLQEKAETLNTREAALQVKVERLSSPERVAEAAGELGMVPNTNPVFLRLSNGEVIGKPVPARPGTNLPGIEPKPDQPRGAAKPDAEPPDKPRPPREDGR